MDTNNLVGEILEKGQSAVQKTAKVATDTAGNLANTASGQIRGSADLSSNDELPDQNEKIVEKQQTDELVKDLYAPSPENVKQPVQKEKTDVGDQAKLAKLRQELHNETYYQPLVNPPGEKEERPAEKVEREKMQDLQNEQEKKEKQNPIAVQRAQQSAEKFRGTTG